MRFAKIGPFLLLVVAAIPIAFRELTQVQYRLARVSAFFAAGPDVTQTNWQIQQSLIGIGAVVLSGAVIGKGSLVAAGSVVGEGKVIPPGMLVMGVPARVLRALSAEQRERVAQGYRTYVALKERYRSSG